MKRNLLVFLLVLFLNNTQAQVKFNVPEIDVPVSEFINLPVVIESNNNEIGSLEFALNYDPTYLEFVGITVSPTAQEWLTYTMDWQGETVRWGGYDRSFGTYSITNDTELFNVRFRVIDQDWTEIPITIGRKTAGTELGWDIDVENTDGYVNKRSMPFDVQPVDGIYGLVYPVPTTGPINLELSVPESGDYRIILLDFAGKNYGEYNRRFFSGYVAFQLTLTDISSGIYLLQVTNGRFIKTFKILKR